MRQVFQRTTALVLAAIAAVSCNKQAAPAPTPPPVKADFIINMGEQQPRAFYVDGKLVDYIVPKELQRIGFASQAAADDWHKLAWHQKLMNDKPRPGMVYEWQEKEQCYKPILPGGG
jgi:hypothetical protein